MDGRQSIASLIESRCLVMRLADRRYKISWAKMAQESILWSLASIRSTKIWSRNQSLGTWIAFGKNLSVVASSPPLGISRQIQMKSLSKSGISYTSIPNSKASLDRLWCNHPPGFWSCWDCKANTVLHLRSHQWIWILFVSLLSHFSLFFLYRFNMVRWHKKAFR